jgi:uncharacterized repeat protein (TIGR01451 family)
MKNMFKCLFVWLLSIAITTTANANDTLVRFGQNQAGAPQWSYIGGGTNLDAAAWKTLAYTETGWLTGIPSAMGFGTNPPARNTAIPEDNTAGGGGVAGARYPTLYFRKVVNVVNPAGYLNFELRTKFDDAIVVWVNGVEAYRNNINASPSYATLANSAIAGDGSVISTVNLSNSMFTAGNNIIAVEIHQSTLTSSDLFFDLELIGKTQSNAGRPFTVRYNNPGEHGNIVFVANNIITTQGVATNENPPGGNNTNNGGTGVYIDIDNVSTPLFSLGSPWKWHADGSLPAADWNTTTYSDATWNTGNGELGYGDGDETTCIPYGCNGDICNPTTNCGKYITYYFRKDINIPSLAGIGNFIFNYKRDDGIVVYVNGTEVFRENMPGGAVNNATLASSSIGNENTVVSFTLNGTGPFVAGNNTIAVEVHQNDATSSDLSFDMGLSTGNNNSTFSSSSADLNLPSTCSEVMFAGLYWGATLGGTNNTAWRTTAKDTIKLKIPGSSVFVNVASTQTDIHDFGVPVASQNHVGYSAFADITSLINTTNANGTYTIADMVGPTGFNNCAGGWSIVIAYRNPADPVSRNLVVFDGASFVTSTDFVDVPFAGFQTPVVGPVTADFGVICYDGDRNNPDGFYFKQDSSIVGAFLDMSSNANAISTSANDDSWNSTISFLNSVVTTRNPAHNNTLGFDADIIRLNNPGNSRLNNNVTSARLRLNSAGEKYYLQTITSAISVAVPTFRGGITGLDINGGTFAPLDSMRYTIGWQNKGSDTATKVYIVDTIPQNVVYKRNSLRINGIAKTDIAGDDEAEWDSVGNRVVFRIGTSATPVIGGQVLPEPLTGNSGTVNFTVNAIDICELLLCNANVVNKAQVFYTGKLSGDDFLDIIGDNGTGCAGAMPVVHTIVGACNSRKDTMLQNRCLATAVFLPTLKYPGYKFYTTQPFVVVNEFDPATAITATGLYYAHIMTSGGCPDTVVLRVRIVNCLDIDDDNDGIPDYVETMIPAALADHDSDGVPNWNDAQYPGRVDYNGDGVDDRFDAGADADNDGIPNYYDTDFTFGGSFIDVNNDRLNDRYDKDLDGIINQYDLDSDNDGIPDVVESYGADANGDAIIDNYTDTDGDGFSQNVDGSNGGSTGSGNGLGAIDLDGDTVPNFLDTDSDQDGIPDVREVFGSDINNRGKIDGFTDADVDGIGDAYLNASALLRTGADVNGDGRADSWPNKNLDMGDRPNPYDMDSDMDGITDVLEAGFADTDLNGRVDGVIGTDGWSTTISGTPSLTLRNTDGIGNPDYLDIDSDDDGIPDNIEGQPTATYKRPITTDVDNDGLVNTYDNINGFGGAGIFLYDHDGDGTPDYRDLDTDGDAQPDIEEGNDFNLNGIKDDDVLLTGLDTDGDGLDNKFDSLNSVTNIKGTSYRMGNNGIFTGDPSPGSRTTVQRKFVWQTDRDWRSVGVVLPLQFFSLTAAQQNNSVQLSWAVITEKEVDYFEIERSTDNYIYKFVGTTIGTTVLNAEQRFAFGDDVSAVTADVIYYRIKAVGKTGEAKYSNIIVVRNTKVQTTVTVQPNPAHDYVTLRFYAEKESMITIRLIDNTGKTVHLQQQKAQRGNNTVVLNSLAKYSKGVYALQLIVNNEVVSRKLILE